MNVYLNEFGTHVLAKDRIILSIDVAVMEEEESEDTRGGRHRADVILSHPGGGALCGQSRSGQSVICAFLEPEMLRHGFDQFLVHGRYQNRLLCD